MPWLLRVDGAEMRLLAPTGLCASWLSRGLSLLELAVTRVTARKYAAAISRLLTAADADLALVAQLGASAAQAEQALRQILTRAHCRLRHHKLAGGAILVTAPAPLAATIDTALTALSHCYDLRADHGELSFANPVQCHDGSTANLVDDYVRRPHRHFVLANPPRTAPMSDDPQCSTLVLGAAAHWPPGIAAAATIIVDQGNRIRETLALTCRDWARFGFAERLACPDKGSRGERTKILYLSAGARTVLTDYVDGPRRVQTGLGLTDLRALAARQPHHPALDAPLLLTTRGGSISYSLFNDYYFRPAMQRLGCPATPHWTRHERAVTGLLAIRAMAVDAEDLEQLLNGFAALMGWRSGLAMLRYYTGVVQEADRRELLARLHQALSAPRPVGHPGPRPAATPALLRAFLAGLPS